MKHHCPVINAGHLLGKRWSILLIEELAFNPGIGFKELTESAKGISPKILTQRLREMGALGLVDREGGRGGAVHYRLTARGKDLRKGIDILKDFSIKWDSLGQACKTTRCSECV